MSAVPARTAGSVVGGAVGLLVGLALLLPSAATAAEPLPLPLPLPSADAIVTALVPSPSPSASPSPGVVDPVLTLLPAPVGGPVREAVGTVASAAPTPAPPPAPAPAPMPAAQPGVQPNAGAAPQQVSAPLTGRAALPALRGGSFFHGGSSGLAPLAAGSRLASLDALFSVPDVAAPLAVLPQATPASGRSGPVPAGLPALVVALAVVTVGGAAAGQVAVLRARRRSVPA